MASVVARTDRLGPQDVEARGLAASDEPAPRDRPLGLAAVVLRLVEIVDADRVVRPGALEPVTHVGVALVVGEAAGIEHQRTASRRELDGQQVVVAMAAVTDRPAVEDQKPLVLEPAVALSPAAALDVVTRRREADVARDGRRAQRAAGRDVEIVRASQLIGGKRQQLRVAAAVGVGQSRDLAVGAVAVHRELERRQQPLVEALPVARPRTGVR